MFLSWDLLEEDAGCSLGMADAGDVGSHAVAGSDSEPVEEPAGGLSEWYAGQQVEEAAGSSPQFQVEDPR